MTQPLKSDLHIHLRETGSSLDFCQQFVSFISVHMPKTLGERIRELRGEKDLSLREFAKKLGGLSAAFLSDIELGRRHPSDKVLADMARVLGTTVDDLRSHDARPPVEELKRLANEDPAWGLAFRRVVEEMVEDKLPPEELLKMLERRKGKTKRG